MRSRWKWFLRVSYGHREHSAPGQALMCGTSSEKLLPGEGRPQTDCRKPGGWPELGQRTLASLKWVLRL